MQYLLDTNAWIVYLKKPWLTMDVASPTILCKPFWTKLMEVYITMEEQQR